MTQPPDDPALASPAARDRVADAPSGNFVYRILPRALWPYAQLARLDRPVGWQLLMWPCFWSAAQAAAMARGATGHVDAGLLVTHLVLFFIGSVAMRGAGCTYNDLVDHRIDARVARTRSRPLPSGRVSRRQAWIFLALQALVGLVVLVQFNLFAIGLALASLVVVAAYPFAKRVTHWPQLVLGIAFSWGALMGHAALFGTVPLAGLLLFGAAIVWTVGYDTIYAHQDKEDDALIGVKSTALLFGAGTKRALVFLYGAVVLLLLASFAAAGLPLPAYTGIAAAAALLARQIVALDIDDPDQCLSLFKSNSTIGLLVFAGLMLPVLPG